MTTPDKDFAAAVEFAMIAAADWGTVRYSRSIGPERKLELHEACDAARQALLARYEAMRVRQEWQPIETAPQGRKVLAGYFNRLGNWRTIIARFYVAGSLDLSDDAEGTEDGYAPAGWYEESETHDDILPCPEVTHWMPLPADRARTTLHATETEGRS